MITALFIALLAGALGFGAWLLAPTFDRRPRR